MHLIRSDPTRERRCCLSNTTFASFCRNGLRFGSGSGSGSSSFRTGTLLLHAGREPLHATRQQTAPEVRVKAENKVTLIYRTVQCSNATHPMPTAKGSRALRRTRFPLRRLAREPLLEARHVARLDELHEQLESLTHRIESNRTERNAVTSAHHITYTCIRDSTRLLYCTVRIKVEMSWQ